MAGGRRTWVEVEMISPLSTRDNPKKGGLRSRTAVALNGRIAGRVGKVYNKIIVSSAYNTNF